MCNFKFLAAQHNREGTRGVCFRLPTEGTTTTPARLEHTGKRRGSIGVRHRLMVMEIILEENGRFAEMIAQLVRSPCKISIYL